MAGAIAGTAILGLERTDQLQTVTLTVNDYCNLDCGYCYLRANGNHHYIGEDVLGLIEKSNFDHLATVGKEPLVNKQDAERTLGILDRFGERGISSSIVTNGTGLGHVTRVPKGLDYIDVSFDGGRETFKGRDKVSYDVMERQIERLSSLGLKVNGLQTVYRENIDQIDSMMEIRAIEGIRTIMFSPYIDTQNYGKDSVGKIDLSIFLRSLSESEKFRSDRDSLALIDRFHLEQDPLEIEQVRWQLSVYGLKHKVKVIEEDPLRFGILRVTHDGKVLTPEQSLHVRDYSKSEKKLEVPLEEIYSSLPSNTPHPRLQVLGPSRL